MVSTPRHRAKYGGDYPSSAPRYAAAFWERVREVTGGSEFWAPPPAVP